MGNPRSKEFHRRYQERLNQAQHLDGIARTEQLRQGLNSQTPRQRAVSRHEELIRRHTPPVAQQPPLEVGGIDQLVLEQIRMRQLLAAERDARRAEREAAAELRRAEESEREEREEQERRSRDTSTAFAVGRKVEID